MDSEREQENPVESSAPTEQSQEAPLDVRLDIVKRLQKAKEVEDRVRVIATAVDLLGLEVAAGMLFPALGDIGAAGINFAYLVAEAKNAGIPLDAWQLAEFAKLKGTDAAVGIVPGVGDAMDYAHASNIRAIPFFEANTQRLAEQARKLGIREEEIQRIVSERNFLLKGLEITMKVANKIYQIIPDSKSTEDIKKHQTEAAQKQEEGESDGLVERFKRWFASLKV